MNFSRLAILQTKINGPVLIKKKENLLYLTGKSFLNGYMLIKPATPKDAKPRSENRQKKSIVFLGDGLEKINGIHLDFLKNVGKYLTNKETLEVFGEFTYAEVRYIKVKNPKLKIKISIKYDPVDYLRQIKSPDEIVHVRKSMQIVEQVFGLVRREIGKPGMTEIKLAEFIQKSGLRIGAEDVSFPAIVASGPNAAVPHHVPTNKRLKPGECIILDFGFKCQNYCSDFTRTVFLNKVPKRLEIVYNQVERAYREAFDLARADTMAEMVYQKAVDVLAEKKLAKYFIHSLGHGTGLEIHELPNLSPNSKDVLLNGMIFSIEPGVYIPKLGGIRIEDLVYLENGHCKKFINVLTDLKNNTL